jgi:hypothetical protein
MKNIFNILTSNSLSFLRKQESTASSDEKWIPAFAGMTVVLLMLLWIILPATQAAGADMMICPDWKTGDKWTVKAVYRSFKTADWSDPVYWEYTVTDCKADDCYLIEVKNQNEKPNLTARFTYRKSPPAPLCERGEECNAFGLDKAEISKMRRGKEISNVLTYKKGVPIQTEQTLIPFDMPVFPLRFPFSADYSLSKPVTGELNATEIIRQECRQVQKAEELTDWTQDQPLTEVKCSKVTGKETKLIFVQYWHKDYPWPLFGQNQNMKYWLVK